MARSAKASAGGASPSPPADPPSPPASTRAPRPRQPGRLRAAVPRSVDNGAGVILALLAWSWVGLPLVQGGPSRVRDVLRCKFLNKGPDGKWLP